LTVFLEKFVVCSFCIFLPVFLFCGEENNPGTVTGTAESFGTFLVQLIPEDSTTSTPAYTKVLGAMADGPTPLDLIFEETMRDGECRLVKRSYPLCQPSCGSNAKCVQTDSCIPYPTKFSVGDVTVSGFKKNGSNIEFTLNPRSLSIGISYQMAGVSLDYPPFTEGDTVTFAAEGTASALPFVLKAPAIAPLKVLTQSGAVVLEDGKPIILNWVPPTVPGISRIMVRVNISYHGSNAGEILADCGDDGELIIPAKLVDELKSYGTAGFPVADITRKSVGADADAKAELVLESTVSVFLAYPDMSSCNGDSDCPGGQTCQDNRVCK
jgi:hypothetical protein